MSESSFGWIDAALADRIALTLIHFLWQGLLIGLLVGLAAMLMRGKAANARYLVLLGGLVSMAAADGKGAKQQ